MNIDYGILGRQFHFEKLDPKDPTSRIGCYGEPNRETTYYMANSNGYQTLKESQFLEVTHLFPTKCATASNNFGGNIKFESTQSPIVQQQLQRNARLSSDNQRMAHSIQSKLKENSITGNPIIIIVTSPSDGFGYRFSGSGNQNVGFCPKFRGFWVLAKLSAGPGFRVRVNITSLA